MNKGILRILASFLLAACASTLHAQSTPVQYVYDTLDRLIKAVDTSGNVATYNYDAVGNLTSISRSTLPSGGALAILSFYPEQGPIGQTVTIQGQGFSTTTTSNTVKFNGTVTTVSAATANTLTVTAPAGATSGYISVTVSGTTATSTDSFTVQTPPTITSISPTVAVGNSSISFTANGTGLTASTFSFLPTFSPAAISVSGLSINGGGTSATMTLTLGSNALGSFTAVATVTGTGSSSSAASSANTFSILPGDAGTDTDGDGLTNIYENAISTNPVAASTTNDGLPDGWALFFGLNPNNSSLATTTAPDGLTYLAAYQRGVNPLINNLTPPSVANVYPTNGASNYPTNGVIVVRFTEPLISGVTLQAAQNAITAGLGVSIIGPFQIRKGLPPVRAALLPTKIFEVEPSTRRGRRELLPTFHVVIPLAYSHPLRLG